MPCNHLRGTLSDGTPFEAIVCTGGARRKRCKCGRPSTKLCDFKLTGAKASKTCDAPLCPRCATSIGPDRDLCPAHARLARETDQQRLPLQLDK